jgi:hypothetical protein
MRPKGSPDKPARQPLPEPTSRASDRWAGVTVPRLNRRRRRGSSLGEIAAVAAVTMAGTVVAAMIASTFIDAPASATVEARVPIGASQVNHRCSPPLERVHEMFCWRGSERVGDAVILARLRADPDRYPPPARRPGRTSG